MPHATHLKVTVVFPSEATARRRPRADRLLGDVVTDATGRVLVAETTEPAGIGRSRRARRLARRRRRSVQGHRHRRSAVSDPDTLDSDSLLNDTITVQVAQLRRR